MENFVARTKPLLLGCFFTLSFGVVSCVSKPKLLTLKSFEAVGSNNSSEGRKLSGSSSSTKGVACYDRSTQSQTAVVDTHLHFRPFGGEALPFKEVLSYLKRTGVLFANVYGIGQMLDVPSPCTYYLDCIGTPVTPTLKNDFVNAANYVLWRHKKSPDLHLTLSMTFPDLSRPETVLSGIRLLDREYPNMFSWMGEVNMVKQALYGNGHKKSSLKTLAKWAPFMKELRKRNIPLAVHADLGNDTEPTKHLYLIKELLRLYPDNKIIWVHMGLSREQVAMDVGEHIDILKKLLDRYPQLMLDISWGVIEESYFSVPHKRALYVPFFNAYSERILPGTDFVASANKTFDIYQKELRETSKILSYLNDKAFRNIALGQNYFRLLNLDYTAPPVCSQP